MALMHFSCACPTLVYLSPMAPNSSASTAAVEDSTMSPTNSSSLQQQQRPCAKFCYCGGSGQSPPFQHWQGDEDAATTPLPASAGQRYSLLVVVPVAGFNPWSSGEDRAVYNKPCDASSSRVHLHHRDNYNYMFAAADRPPREHLRWDAVP